MFYCFFLKKSHTTQGNNVFITHSTTPAIAACMEPKMNTAHAPLTPTSTMGILGVMVTNR